MAPRFRIISLVAILLSFVSSGAAATGKEPPSRSQLMKWDEVSSGFRFQLDEKRGRVWVAKQDAIYVYDTGKRSLVRRIGLSGWMFVAAPYNCGPDLALLPSGNVLVTSDILPIIWKIHPETFAVRRYELQLDADNGKDVGFSALAYRGEAQQLIGYSGQLGSFWQIDLRSLRAYKLHTSSPAYGACAHPAY
jgi:hypothetical protein